MELKRTPLHAFHVARGARMAEFGGYDMPIQYEGIMVEHHAARTGAALFDTCHMGEFLIEGPGATQDLDRLVSCKVGTIAHGQCRYGLLCTEDGGVRDDLIVYRKTDDSYMVVVNAGTQDDDFAWIAAHLSPATTATNGSATTAKIDIQGPAAPRIVEALIDGTIADLKYFRFKTVGFDGQDLLISRTGYTGEAGFEAYGPDTQILNLWNACVEAGAVPAGLGARDTLRLEMGMPLYGHEMSTERNAADAGMNWAIAADKEFIGSQAIRKAQQDPAFRLCGLALESRQAARQGNAVMDAKGLDAGIVTSGSPSPSLGHAIALAYVRPDLAVNGTGLTIQTERKALSAKVCELPFYRNATARRPMKDML